MLGMSLHEKQTYRQQPCQILKKQYKLNPTLEPLKPTTSKTCDLNSMYVQKCSYVSEWPKIVACLSTNLMSVLVGSVFSYSAVLIPQLESTDTEIKVTKEDISWIASVAVLVVPLGSLVTGYLVDRVGRLNTLKASCLPNMLGWACIATAQNIPIMIVGRILTGLSVAMASNPATVYIAEVITPDLRGTLTSTGVAFSAVGLILVYTAGALLSWRTVAWLAMIYPLLPVLLLSTLSSESPVWLVSKGRNEDALKSLYFLHRNVKEIGVAKQQLSELVKEHNTKLNSSENKGPSLLTFLKGFGKPSGFKPFLLLFFTFVFQQSSGAYICIFYAHTFFQTLGATIDPYVCSIGIGVVRLLCGLLTSFLMKHFGRRPLLMFSGSGMALTMFLAGFINKQVVEGNMESTSVPAVCILIYLSLSVVGLMTLPWTMTAELFPLDIRGLSQGLIISLAYILMFGSLKVYPFLKDILGYEYRTLWLFAGLSLISVVYVFIFFPETHNKTLDEIQDYFLHSTVYVLSVWKRKKGKIKLKEPDFAI